jgi:outer membrane protein assembly factor BamB
MISAETGLPASFDPETGVNIKWSAPLGDNAYGTPIVAGGKVLIGANNKVPRDPRHQGDRAVLLCLNESDGSLCWQLVVPRIGGDDFLDWPMIAICSPPTVDGDRAYAVTNRLELVCLDMNGQANGNDGPYQDEGAHMTPAGEPPLDVTPQDADIVWMLDLVSQVDVHPHDSPHASVLMDGQYLYLNTCNGVESTHKIILKPDAPSLIVVDKATGRVVAQDGERIGPMIFHSTWSPPAMGTINGQKQVFFGGGDGVCYGFEALPAAKAPETPQTLKRIWRFDCDPTAPKQNLAEYLNNKQESPSNILSTPVFHKNRLYVTVGGDIWWGKRQSWLKCIDATQSGDVTKTAELWSYPLVKHCSSTPSIADGLVFVADCGGMLHCVDAETGQPYWTHDLGREVWGSTLVADGKVYVGTRGREFWVLAASKEKQVLSTIKFGGTMASTPVAANGVLYVSTLEHLFAIKEAPKP